MSDADEILREAVKIIKSLALTKVPNYQLPADSFIESAARQIIAISKPKSAQTWVSVKDRLPSDSGMKMVFIPTADESKPLIWMAWFEPEGTDNLAGWQLMADAYCGAITHWAPLLAPPEKP